MFYVFKIFYIQKPFWRIYNYVFKMLKFILPQSIYKILKNFKSKKLNFLKWRKIRLDNLMESTSRIWTMKHHMSSNTFKKRPLFHHKTKYLQRNNPIILELSTKHLKLLILLQLSSKLHRNLFLSRYLLTLYL